MYASLCLLKVEPWNLASSSALFVALLLPDNWSLWLVRILYTASVISPDNRRGEVMVAWSEIKIQWLMAARGIGRAKSSFNKSLVFILWPTISYSIPYYPTDTHDKYMGTKHNDCCETALHYSVISSMYLAHLVWTSWFSLHAVNAMSNVTLKLNVRIHFGSRCSMRKTF